MKFKGKIIQPRSVELEEIVPRISKAQRKTEAKRLKGVKKPKIHAVGKTSREIRRDVIPALRRKLHNMLQNRGYYKRLYFDMRKQRNKIKYRYTASMKYHRLQRENRKVKRVIHTDSRLIKKNFTVSEKLLFVMAHTPALRMTDANARLVRFLFLIKNFGSVTKKQMEAYGFPSTSMNFYKRSGYINIFGDMYSISDKGERLLTEREELFATEVKKMRQIEELSYKGHAESKKALSLWKGDKVGV